MQDALDIQLVDYLYDRLASAAWRIEAEDELVRRGYVTRRPDTLVPRADLEAQTEARETAA